MEDKCFVGHDSRVGVRHVNARRSYFRKDSGESA